MAVGETFVTDLWSSFDIDLALHFRVNLRAQQHREDRQIRPEKENDDRAERSEQHVNLRDL